MNYNEEYDGTEIDIVDILMIFWSKKFLIAAFVIIFALCGFGYTGRQYFFVQFAKPLILSSVVAIVSAIASD